MDARGSPDDDHLDGDLSIVPDWSGSLAAILIAAFAIDLLTSRAALQWRMWGANGGVPVCPGGRRGEGASKQRLMRSEGFC